MTTSDRLEAFLGPVKEAKEAFAVIRDIRRVMDWTLTGDRVQLDRIMEVLDGTDIGAIGGRREPTPGPACEHGHSAYLSSPCPRCSPLPIAIRPVTTPSPSEPEVHDIVRGWLGAITNSDSPPLAEAALTLLRSTLLTVKP